MRCAIPSLPQYVFMAWCLVQQRDNFTFFIFKVKKSILVPVLNQEPRQKMYGGTKVELLTLLTSALNEGEWSTSRPGRFTLPPGKEFPVPFG
jgi:hypothetical protein